MLTAKIMRQFQIAKDWGQAGYYETARSKEIGADVRAAIMAGRLIALSGPVGVGKTMLIKQLQARIITDKKVIFARSLSIDKPRVVLPALMTALFLDITGDPGMKVPTQPERRERLLQEAIKTAKKPVVLFIDEAHDLHGNTLNGLKRLMEIVDAGGGVLSIVLVGHPRLQNDLRRATMEEIGHRSTTIEIAGLGKDARPFIDWLLKQCLAEGTKPDDVISVEARDFLAEKLNTPLQIAEHLNRAFTDAFRMGAGSVTREIVEETISAGFDDLDARLARVGYTPKALAEQFDLGQAEVRRFLKGKLDTDRTHELGDLMRQAGLPI
jgi:type II secretory pathway predicted ATPase ExeA